jgi:pimeloyl-ACP methyl ester carboxylesterase
MSSFPARFSGVVALWALSSLLVSVDAAEAVAGKPTVVLVHGAFADSSSWNPVITELVAKGYPTIAVANPLRGLKSDADYVASVLKTINGPVVLVGHSYGGAVITNAATGAANVKALVYVAAFAPEKGETAIGLSGLFPGSTLGPALAPPVVLADGAKDLYIQQDKLPAQFAADVPAAQARRMAATQRPVTEAALTEASGEAAWKSIPSWFIYGEQDKNIPAAVVQFEAKRAGAKESVGIKGGSHVVMLSHPQEVSRLIEDAAKVVSNAHEPAKTASR